MKNNFAEINNKPLFSLSKGKICNCSKESGRRCWPW